MKRSQENTPKPNPENLTTVAKLAKELNVSRMSIYNYIDRGDLKKVEFMGKTWVDRSTYIPRPLKETTKTP